MVENSFDVGQGIEKQILHGGCGGIPTFVKNTKAKIHFRTFKIGDDDAPIDDTRKMGGGPFEMLIGREFQLPEWEKMVRSMCVGEVARFDCLTKQVALNYVNVSKLWRRFCASQTGHSTHGHHVSHASCCNSLAAGTGHQDLDKLIASPCQLRFEFELVAVLQPEEYRQEMWALTVEEKEEMVPQLQKEGNSLFGSKCYNEALKKYQTALQYLSDVRDVEQPGSERFKELHDRQLPFLLNAAQCEIKLEEFETAASHCSLALEIDPSNVKALFRQGLAQIGCWQPLKARLFFAKAKELDPSLVKMIDCELERLSRLEREHDANDAKRLRSFFCS